jgi:hypothetical protein
MPRTSTTGQDGDTRRVEPIEAYVADLDRALRGPRRAKADLLREARDGLADTAESYAAGGLSRDDAARRAVADFGAVAAVAPAYQRELGSAQSVRTALVICLVLAPQDAAWDLVQGGQPSVAVGGAYGVILGLMSWIGGAALIGCLSAVALHGIGQRVLPPRPGLTRAVGVFAVAVAVVFSGTAAALALLGPAQDSLAGWAATTGLVVAPMAVVARFGQRCLAYA